MAIEHGENHETVEHGSRVWNILLIKWGMAETNNKIWHDEDKREYRNMINSDSGASFQSLYCHTIHLMFFLERKYC